MPRFRPPKFATSERDTLRIARPRPADLTLSPNEYKEIRRAVPRAVSETAKDRMSQRSGYDRATGGQKARARRAAFLELDEHIRQVRKETDFANPVDVQHIRQLERQREGLRKSIPSGSDARVFNPHRASKVASTIFGTAARFTAAPRAFAQAFSKPQNVVPCLQRKARREVMFAFRQAGIGHRTKHRRTPNSEVPC